MKRWQQGAKVTGTFRIGVSRNQDGPIIVFGGPCNTMMGLAIKQRPCSCFWMGAYCLFVSPVFVFIAGRLYRCVEVVAVLVPIFKFPLISVGYELLVKKQPIMSSSCHGYVRAFVWFGNTFLVGVTLFEGDISLCYRMFLKNDGQASF